MRRSRTRAERDAATVEMVFAAVSGAVLAAVGFLAVASPVMADEAHGTAREGWFTAAVIVAAATFCGRVAVTLRRFERRGRLDRLPEQGGRYGSDRVGAMDTMDPLEEMDGMDATGREYEARFGAELDAGSGSGSGSSHHSPDGKAVTRSQPSQPGRTRPDS